MRYTLALLAVASTVTAFTLPSWGGLNGQQPMDQDGTVGPTNSWSFTDCGESISSNHSAPPSASRTCISESVIADKVILLVSIGSPSDIIQIHSLTVSPDPPEPGKNLTVKAKGFVSQTIEDGAYADVTVKLGLIKLLHKQFDVCEEARNNNAEIQCPVEPGEHEVEQTVLLPKEVPRAKFIVQVRGYTVDDDDMLCADLKVDFMKHPF
ncbi:Phosphatidylglycerol/phosphatidylinositol transfer protein [Tulasnella sp. 403]|nr:Phosphatidylglycerol/phosphatidylinositol transfer protein [Tulasnella sp. 403]